MQKAIILVFCVLALTIGCGEKRQAGDAGEKAGSSLSIEGSWKVDVEAMEAAGRFEGMDESDIGGLSFLLSSIELKITGDKITVSRTAVRPLVATLSGRATIFQQIAECHGNAASVVMGMKYGSAGNMKKVGLAKGDRDANVRYGYKAVHGDDGSMKVQITSASEPPGEGVIVCMRGGIGMVEDVAPRAAKGDVFVVTSGKAGRLEWMPDDGDLYEKAAMPFGEIKQSLILKKSTPE